MHLGPVGDVGTEAELCIGIRFAEAVVAALLIDLTVIVVGHLRDGVIDVRRRGEDAAVLRCCGDGAGVHQRHGRNLPLTGLGAFPVGEVPGGVADGEGVIGRDVSRTEAGAAEGGFHNSAGFQKVGGHTVAGHCHAHRHGGGIDA